MVSVFLYPRPGVRNIQYFEAISPDLDKNDLDGYVPVLLNLMNVFNGYLKKFEVELVEEKWVIISFEEDNKIHLSNPIRIKNMTKPTEYITENVAVEARTVTPLFTWEDGIYDDTNIYFQVITNATNDFISGTYTFEKALDFMNWIT